MNNQSNSRGHVSQEYDNSLNRGSIEYPQAQDKENFPDWRV